MVGGIQSGSISTYQNAQSIGGSNPSQQNAKVETDRKAEEALKTEEQNSSANDSGTLRVQAQADEEASAPSSSERGSRVDISV